MKANERGKTIHEVHMTDSHGKEGIRRKWDSDHIGDVLTLTAFLPRKRAGGERVSNMSSTVLIGGGGWGEGERG